MNGLELFTKDAQSEPPRQVSAGKLDRNFARCMPAKRGLLAGMRPNFARDGWWIDLNPPADGTYVLGAVNGQIQWLATQDC